MDITRSEQFSQSKHLLQRQTLHAKRSWLLLIVLIVCGVGHAQNGLIHRCIGENGEPTFSDQKCAALKTAPATELPSTSPVNPGIETSASNHSALPWITQTCAISPQDLRDRVAAAFSAANAVGFSGLFLWDGFGHGSAIAPLRELATLIHEPLISIDLGSTLQFREPNGPRDREDRYAGDKLYELVIRTLGEQARNVPFESVHQYDMREYAGCWWLLIPW